jgi:hypothetical protein
VTIRCAIFDRDVLAIDEAGLAIAPAAATGEDEVALAASVTTLNQRELSATAAAGKVYIRAMSKTAPDDYEKALHRMLDENEAQRAEIARLNGQLSTLVDWIMGDADALTTLQAVYLNSDEPAGNRIKAAAAAIGYERPKLSATGLVVVDFRERVRRARLAATAKLIEHMPDTPEPA